jgi:hypothetical protein
VPYNVEHAARVKNPGLFKDDGWARKEITPGVSIIFGHLKKPAKSSSPDATTTQAYRFDKAKFTAEQARK